MTHLEAIALTPANLLMVDPSNWRVNLPTLTSSLVTLREPTLRDTEALVALLSLGHAPRFGGNGPISTVAARRLVDRAIRDRVAGVSFTYVIVLNGTRTVVGLLQVRRLDPAFATAEWDCMILPFARGSGAFLEAARLAGSFAFGTVGAHRLEARVSFANGRGNGALRKLGAVQEGVLRRSCRRAGQYVDQALWSLLREDWGDRWMSAAALRVH